MLAIFARRLTFHYVHSDLRWLLVHIKIQNAIIFLMATVRNHVTDIQIRHAKYALCHQPNIG